MSLTKRRSKNSNAPILSQLEEVRRVRKGSKVSRLFRFVFEKNGLKKLLGRNIAFAVLATSLIPTGSTLATNSAQALVTTQSPIVLPTEKDVHFPLLTIKINQGFKFYHPALDFDGETGDSIFPVMRGVVEAIDESRFGYGNAIYVNHGAGLVSLYAHLSKILVKVGDEVTPGREIGKMGSTGRSTGSHLHLELRQNNIPINPLTILPH